MEQTSIQNLSAPWGEFIGTPQSSQPIIAKGYELRPDFITLVQELSFSGKYFENPYHHLREFEQLCACLAIYSMAHDTLWWKLFPFSLNVTAKQWYTYTGGSMHGRWDTLQDKCCLEFFPLPCMTSYV